MKEKELLEKGWKKETLVFGISEYNTIYPNNSKTLEYDMRDDFTQDQIETIKSFINIVNGRFLNIKMFVRGGGYFLPEEQNSDNGNDR